jgi:hypothetical protein
MQSPASRFDRWKTRDERHEKRRDALRDEAIEIASRNHATRYGTTEVRPVWEV